MTTFAESGQPAWTTVLRDGPSPVHESLAEEHFAAEQNLAAQVADETPTPISVYELMGHMEDAQNAELQLQQAQPGPVSPEEVGRIAMGLHEIAETVATFHDAVEQSYRDFEDLGDTLKHTARELVTLAGEVFEKESMLPVFDADTAADNIVLAELTTQLGHLTQKLTPLETEGRRLSTIRQELVELTESKDPNVDKEAQHAAILEIYEQNTCGNSLREQILEKQAEIAPLAAQKRELETQILYKNSDIASTESLKQGVLQEIEDLRIRIAELETEGADLRQKQADMKKWYEFATDMIKGMRPKESQEPQEEPEEQSFSLLRVARERQ
jgi:chromosome segregation ATPase